MQRGTHKYVLLGQTALTSKHVQQTKQVANRLYIVLIGLLSLFNDHTITLSTKYSTCTLTIILTLSASKLPDVLIR